MRLRWLLFGALAFGSAAAAEPVPFVGCPANGQVGPRAAPRSGAVPDVPAPAAAGLAYYASEDVGVLGPRGWHCFQTYGSNGSSLVVTPNARDAPIFRDGRIRGPAIQLSYDDGGTSGRWMVASMIARYFPAHSDFIRRAREMEFLRDPLPRGPYPGDRTVRRGSLDVEIMTPPGVRGLGTDWLLAPGSLPVRTLVMLQPTGDFSVVAVRVRMPAGQAALTPAIISSVRSLRGARSR